VDWLADLQPEQPGASRAACSAPDGTGPAVGGGKPVLRMKLPPGRVDGWWFSGPAAGAGLSDAAMSVLRAAVDETEVLARYQTKTRQMKGSDCLWWTGAVSARGHCRFWLGRAGDRDVTVIAYRFAWALEHGAASLLDVPVLGHRCDHRSASGSGRGTCRPPATWRTPASGPAAGTPSAHPYETAAAPAAGSRACATCSASAASELKAAIDAGLILDAAQLALWSDDEPSPTTANGFPDTGGAAASSEAGAA